MEMNEGLTSNEGDATLQLRTKFGFARQIKRPNFVLNVIVLLAAIGLGVWDFTSCRNYTNRINFRMTFVNESGNAENEYLRTE